MPKNAKIGILASWILTIIEVLWWSMKYIGYVPLTWHLKIMDDNKCDSYDLMELHEKLKLLEQSEKIQLRKCAQKLEKLIDNTVKFVNSTLCYNFYEVERCMKLFPDCAVKIYDTIKEVDGLFKKMEERSTNNASGVLMRIEAIVQQKAPAPL